MKSVVLRCVLRADPSLLKFRWVSEGYPDFIPDWRTIMTKKSKSRTGDQSLEAITAAAAGINTDEQIRIALNTILANGGAATMAQIHDAVTQETERRHPGKTLSKQGYSSLCNTVNTAAVQAGYIKLSLSHPAL